MGKTVPMILVVDDDPVSIELVKANLHHIGWDNVVSVSNGRDAIKTCRTSPISLVILDLFMPGMSGTEVLEVLVQDVPHVPVVVVTTDDSVEAAVQCMKIGAFDFMTKPVEHNRLESAINHALRVRDLENRLNLFGEEGGPIDGPQNEELFSRIITRSSKMIAVFQYIEVIAPSPKAVLITGESGTGKELLARALHDAGGRAGQFVTVNVAGLDDIMFSDTLFGHRRGAFTGADRDRGGLIERAAGGTLFLDEIGDLDIASQVKLLRLLQENEYYPLGSDEPVYTNVRIVSATNVDLLEKQRHGTFRKDLYYRLIAHLVHIPPLRERPEDIAPLIRMITTDIATSLGRKPPSIDDRTIRLLEEYSFPGNVRELQVMLVDAVSQSRDDALSTETIEEYIARHGSTRHGSPRHGPKIEDRLLLSPTERFSWSGEFPRLDEVEGFLIDEALRRTDNNQSAAARLLGVSQSTLSRRLRKNG